MIHVLTTTATNRINAPVFAVEFRPNGDTVEVVRHSNIRHRSPRTMSRVGARNLWRQITKSGKFTHLGSFPNADRTFLAIRDFINP